METTYDIDTIDSVNKLRKDLRLASALLKRQQAVWLVKSYYQWQEERIAAAARVRTSNATDEPNEVLDWSLRNMEIVERQTAAALKYFASRYKVGNWLMSICGIGPVISAGLLAHLDVRDRHAPSAFWRYAGMDPSAIWMKGQKRPWNAELKVLLWKAGESFVKVSANPKDVYGKVYAKRKQLEWEKNLQGAFSEQATAAIAAKNIGKTTMAYRFYSGQMSPAAVKEKLELGGVPQDMKATSRGDEKPMLPPGHIHARSTRYASKLFLSHVHHVMHEDYYGEEPRKPYCFDHLDGHTDYIAPPNWSGQDHKGERLTELLTTTGD